MGAEQEDDQGPVPDPRCEFAQAVRQLLHWRLWVVRLSLVCDGARVEPKSSVAASLMENRLCTVFSFGEAMNPWPVVEPGFSSSREESLAVTILFVNLPP